MGDAADERFVILVAGDDPNARAKTIVKLQTALGPVQFVESRTMWETARQCEALPRVDFIVVDDELVEQVGTRFLSGLNALQPAARLMVFGPPRARGAAIKMLEAGAAAYLPTDLAPADIAKAFDLVLSGAVFAPIPSAARPSQGEETAPRALVLPFPGVKPDATRLSTNERDILALLARGRSNAEIAFLLGLSENQVGAAVTALMGHMGFRESSSRPRGPSGDDETGERADNPDDRPN